MKRVFNQHVNRQEYLVRYQFWSKIIKKYVTQKGVVVENVLDIGCSDGSFKDFLGKKLKLKNQIIGLEPDSMFTSQDAAIYCGLSSNIPFQDNNFDLVIMLSVFEHIPIRERLGSLSEVYRVLKPGSTLFIQMPNPKFPIEFHTRLPLIGYLPRKLQLKFVEKVKKSKLRAMRNFWSISIIEALTLAKTLKFKLLSQHKYNYPIQIVP
ncbi:MAG: class I SAM-dependent methyltransferase, partial [Candidatus Heimdallarchaeota archaeon]|nr:class I SAM-dependent methyltransferase [Candidatus Heimdallarchaeota archaeon]